MLSIITFSGALVPIYAATFCLPTSMCVLIFSFYCFLSAMALYKAVTASSPLERRLCFGLQAAVRLVLFCLRLTRFGGGHPDALIHVALLDILQITGGFIGALRIPELWFPGKFDYIGNSHQCMHVMVVIAVIHLHTATKFDLVWASQGNSQCMRSR